MALGSVVEVRVPWWVFAVSSTSFNSAVSAVFLLCVIQILNLLYLRDNTKVYLVPEVQLSGNNMLSGITSIIKLKNNTVIPRGKAKWML